MRDFRPLAMIFTLLLVMSIAVALSGCASNLSDEDREYNRGVDRHNWETCELLYQRAGQLYVTGMSTRIRKQAPRHYEVLHNLRINRCRVVIPCKYWENHIDSNRKCHDE